MPLHVHTATIRWSDCDANGHVRNTAYSEYGIDARIGFLAANGWTIHDFAKHRFGPVITREEIDYLRELHMGDEIAVDVHVRGLSNDLARFKFAHTFTRKRDGKECARIVLVGGWLDLAKRRLAPPPGPLAEIMRRYERDPEWEVLQDARKD